MKNAYKAITASAGSGKTYTLVQKLLMICLAEPQQHTVIQNILALTFTNKAANEMKSRILGWLDGFAADDYLENNDLKGLLQALKKQGKTVDIEELHLRAKKLRDYILHNYSVLNISTIDKFNAKLVRSFAYELGLAKNFNIEINADPYLIEAIDQMLEKVGEDEKLSTEFIDFVEYNYDNEKRVNLHNELFRSAKNYISDTNYEALKKNEKFDSLYYQKATETLQKRIQQINKEIVTIAERSLQLIEKQGLSVSDFSGGRKNSIVLFFENIIQKNDIKLRASTEDEEKTVANYLKGASSSGKKKENEVLSILEPLMNARMDIIQKEVEKQKISKIMDALLPLKVQQNLQKELALIENENDLVLLSKFNILIHENLQKEPAPFIYEKVGTRFQHFFLDEFQDTSLMQWKNIIPLRDESIAQDKTSFTIVGDPKQSIYRFRGGDSQIMIDILNHNEITPQPATIEILDSNWRSAANIVAFNNTLYEWHSHTLAPEHQEIFGKNAFQKPQSSKKGRVKVHLMEQSIKTEFYEAIAEKMHHDIQECVNNGYALKDITILCRNTDDIFHLITLLSQRKIQYENQEIFIKTLSERGLTLDISHTLNALIHFLKWNTNTKREQDFILMLHHLNQIKRINFQDFTEESLALLQLDTQVRLEKLKTDWNLHLSEVNGQHFNLYNSVENLIHQMKMEGTEGDFILSFLEEVYSFSQNTSATPKRLTQLWDEELHKKTLQASENLDAIQLMTIHKSKGLEFPIVFLPIRKDNKDSKFIDWFSVDSIDGISSVNIDGFKGNLNAYDENIRAFNEKNIYQNKIDRLSLQYVATTRPIDQLFLYLEKPNQPTQNELVDFILEKFPNAPEELEFFEDFDAEKTSLKNHVAPTQDTLNISGFSSTETPTQITIATPSKSYQQKDEKVRMGIFIHELLSKISTEKDLLPTLQKYILKGIIHHKEAQIIQKNIEETIRKYPEYFSPKHTILNERELIYFENGQKYILRPDRIISTEEGVYIIDFKTGTEHEKYKNQMRQYQNALENMGKKVIGTDLVYLNISLDN
ncbi:UvrD-helicase domain-containing protein [Bergeyella zoohelcum]|uniref:UvrD-helicase domain-containing protein n=1 Tax=Bergeyella zoohelcum TaxID=1015 RepID=UPI002A90E294|nr:UvrD-helicase domain-containing protein [Bergeyella zoohelcum]MDY6026241.1 UvrD-helicase domain-containing protein [Bergeyella zoohelcum]